MCIETAGGSFIAQFANWAIPLFCFLLSRRRKQNACKSPLSREKSKSGVCLQSETIHSDGLNV